MLNFDNEFNEEKIIEFDNLHFSDFSEDTLKQTCYSRKQEILSLLNFTFGSDEREILEDELRLIDNILNSSNETGT